MNADRRSFLKYCGMVSLGLGGCAGVGPRTVKKKPNVILFMTDDQFTEN